MAGAKLEPRAIALRVVKEFKDGMLVNLGSGMPTLCGMFLPTDREVLLHAENGLVGYGTTIENPDEADLTLVNAGIQPVRKRPGMAIVDHAESFSIIRGGHIDISVLGAHVVSEFGDLANNTTPGKLVGSLGGGQDLAFCAKKVIVMMTHVDKNGGPKLVKKCAFRLTAPRCVKLVITDIAVVEIDEHGLTLLEVLPGWTPAEVQELTEPKLRISPNLREMELV
jgi:3-oxoacid CoA-transferase subunit B